MSNYPPGVTGNEPQIAGYRVTEISIDCGSGAFEVVEKHWVMGEIEKIRHSLNSALMRARVAVARGQAVELRVVMAGAADSLSALTQMIEARSWEQHEVPCEETIEDEVDVANGEYEVECPRCGTVHRREIE